MKKISIYHAEETNLHDIMLFDLNSEDMEIFTIKGLNHIQAMETVSNLINKYNLQPTDKIVTYHFDKDEYIKGITRETVEEFQK